MLYTVFLTIPIYHTWSFALKTAYPNGTFFLNTAYPNGKASCTSSRPLFNYHKVYLPTTWIANGTGVNWPRGTMNGVFDVVHAQLLVMRFWRHTPPHPSTSSPSPLLKVDTQQYLSSGWIYELWTDRWTRQRGINNRSLNHNLEVSDQLSSAVSVAFGNVNDLSLNGTELTNQS